MDTSDSLFGAKQEHETKLLTLACRFIPYDQWLVTHVDPSWKVDQVKAWLLSKCVSNATSNTAPTPSSSSLPPIDPPSKPRTRPTRRPASPIVFAEFAPPEGGSSRPGEPSTSADLRMASSDDDDILNKRPKDALEKDGEAIGMMGYEEDDEYSSDDMEDELDIQPRTGRKAYRNQYLGYFERNPQAARTSADRTSAVSLANNTRSIRTSSTAAQSASSAKTHTRKGSYATYHPACLTLIRFSTGQILEHHYPLSWYDMKPYELVEIHRSGVIMKIPREIAIEYVKPYWEGWVKALRVVFRGEARSHAHGSEGGEGKTKEPAEDKEAKEGSDRGSVKPKLGSGAQATVEAVWKMSGAHGHPSGAADTIASLPSRAKSSKRRGKRSVDEKELFGAASTSSVRTHSVYSQAGDTPNSRSSRGNINNGSYNRGRSGKLEWRERWVFIKDGVLHLRKECTESLTATTQILPLSALAEIRGSEQLGRSATIPTVPGSVQRIVCAKFKTRMTTARFSDGANVNTNDAQEPYHKTIVGSVSTLVSTSPPTASTISKATKFRRSNTKSSQPSRAKEPRSPGTPSTFNAVPIPRTQPTPSMSTSPGAGTASLPGIASSVPLERISPSASAGKVPSYAAASIASPLGPIVLSNTSNLSSKSPKPKITLNTNSLSAHAGGSVNRIQGKPRSSSLRIIPGGPREKRKEKMPLENPWSPPSSSTVKATPQYSSLRFNSMGPVASDDTEHPSNEAAGGTPSGTASEAQTEEDGLVSDDEAEPDDRPRLRRDTSGHPAELNTKLLSGSRTNLGSDADSDELSGSGGTLSSPVFAHSDDDESDLSAEGVSHRSYGYGITAGYTYGFDRRRRHGLDRAAANMTRSHRGVEFERKEESEAEAGADTSYVVVSGGEGAGRMDTSQEKGKSRQNAGAMPPRRPSTGRRRTEPDSEWIVLDLGDDHAFKSFLRVLHRHAPHEVYSSFLSSLPTFNIPTPTTPAPTPIFTATFPDPPASTKTSVISEADSSVGEWSRADPGGGRKEAGDVPRRYEDHILREAPLVKTSPPSPPTSPTASLRDSHFPGETGLAEGVQASSDNGVLDDIQTPTSPIAFAPSTEAEQYRLRSSPRPSVYDISPQIVTTTTTMSSRSIHQPDSACRPLSLKIPSWSRNLKHAQSKYSILKSSLQKNAYGTFGALPYPEWRMEVVMKAQRAGMGDLPRAMELFLWGDASSTDFLSNKDLGLSLSSGSIKGSTLGSVTVHEGSTEKSPGGVESLGSGENEEEDASLRRHRRRRDRKLTLEQENKAMGLDLSSSSRREDLSSVEKLGSPSVASRRHSMHSYVSSLVDSPYEDSFYAVDANAETSKSAGDRPDLKLGYVDMDDSDSGEESSDAEWLGWMADIRRQAKVREQEEVQEKQRQEAEASLGISEGDFWDYPQQDDHRRYQEERLTYEPSAVVTSIVTPSYPSPSNVVSTPQQQVGHQHHTSQASSVSSTISRAFGSSAGLHVSPFSLAHGPGTPTPETAVSSVLTSPSSNESLGRPRGRRLSFGLSNVEPPSSATSPALSYMGHTPEDLGKKSEFPISQHRRLTSGSVRSDGTIVQGLMHHASTGLIDCAAFVGGQVNIQSAREREFHSGYARRPSMPVMSTSTFPASSSATISTSSSQALNKRPSVDATTGLNVDAALGRASNVGMTSVSQASLGRSSSVLGRGPGILRKKEQKTEKSKHKDKGKEKEKEKSSKGKGKEKERSNVKDPSTDGDAGSTSRRQRLSFPMTASGSRQSLRQITSSRPQSPTPASPTSKPKSSVRRVKSGSSLLSGEEAEAVSAVKNPPVKKKKGLVKGVSYGAERILMGFESTLDFVDGR